MYNANIVVKELNMKLIIIDSKLSNIKILDNFIIHGIGKNKFIQAVILSGFILTDIKLAEYKHIQSQNDVIKIFEYIKEIR